MTEDRREAARHTVDIPARVGAGTLSMPGRVKSLSHLGALVVTEEPLAIGTVVHLVVEQEPTPTWEILGQVVRAEGSHPTAHAILFGPLPRETLNRIASLVGSD